MSTTARDGADPLEPAAEEFVARLRRGERPALSEYKARHPELAERIDELFPALVELEQFGSVAAAPDRPAAVPAAAPRRLGDYRILREVGRGGMGIVYEAVQESLGRHVALKILPDHAHLLPNHLERFRREARSAARLHHTNIVPVFGVGEDQGVHYFAMQFIPGLGLHLVLDEVRRFRAGVAGAVAEAPRRAPPGSMSAPTELLLAGRVAAPTGPWPAAEPSPGVDTTLPEPGTPAPAAGGSEPAVASRSGLSGTSDGDYFRGVARVGLQVAEALAYAHGRGVLHRDIKPSNLLLEADGTVWVTDFGLAKDADGDDLTGTGDVVGTLRYLAPERFEGASGAAGDVYALGATLYELATLRPPFEATSRAQLIDRILHADPVPPRAVDRRVPRDLETVVLKAMAKEPAERYPSAGQMAEDLRRFLADRPIRARRASSWERAWRWARRNPAVAALLAAVVTLSVAIAAGASASRARLADSAESLRTSLKRVEHAERTARERLRESLVAQARAWRWSGLAGRRSRSLDALAEAAGIRPDPELRDEVIAALALVDLRPLREWDGHTTPGQGVAFDPPLARYAVGDADGGVSVRRAADDRLLARFPRDGANGCRARPEFSPDGRFLAVVTRDLDHRDRVALWDLDAGGSAPRLQADWRLAFRPDSRVAATVLADGALGLYDLATGRLQRRGGSYRRDQLLYHPAGSTLLISAPGDEPALAVVEADTGRVRDTLRLPARPEALAWRDDGRLLAVAGDDRRIHTWDAAARRWLTPLQGHRADIQGLAFRPDGTLLASTGWDFDTRLWDVARGREVVRIPGSFCRYARDGRRLAYRNGPRVGLWELEGGRELQRVPIPAGAVDFSPDGARLAIVGRGVVPLCDAATGRELARLEVGVDPDESTAVFRPGDGALVTYAPGVGLLSWPLRGGAWSGPPAPLGGPTPGHWQWARWSADGRRLAAADHDHGRVVVLEPGGPSRPIVLKGVPGVLTVALSPDGRWAAAGAWRAGVIRVWEVDRGRSRALPAGPSFAYHVAFSPDGSWLVAGGADDYRWWHVGDWRPGPVLSRDHVDGHAGPLAFTPDGRLLAIARTPTDVQLVDPATRRPLATLSAPEPALIGGLCFSPDGARLAAAVGADGVQLWDLRALRRQLAERRLDWEDGAAPSAELSAPAGRPGS